LSRSESEEVMNSEWVEAEVMLNKEIKAPIHEEQQCLTPTKKGSRVAMFKIS